jgi:hypothetical protein
MTRSLGGASCRFTGDARCLPRFPQALPLPANDLERLTMLIADLPGLFCQSPESFRLVPGGLG